MKPVKTWILIADAGKARIVENAGPGKGLFQLNNKTYEGDTERKFSDDQGRIFNSTTLTRHKMEISHRVDAELESYVDEILSDLSVALGRREFDRLIICAAHDTLGVMRNRMPDNLKQIVLTEIAKDLTHIPTDDLAPYFDDVLAV